jgi:hypothetical protein
MPVIPNASEFSDAEVAIPRLAQVDCKTITLKGYHGWAGRAKVALEAVRDTSQEFESHQIAVYSANSSFLKIAKRVSKKLA